MKGLMIYCVAVLSVVQTRSLWAQADTFPSGTRFVPDVPGQFQALTERADALGLHIGSSPNPSACKHYQAITRVDGPDGTPFFLVTRSGILPDTIPIDPGLFCDDSPGETDNGNLIVFRMGSRDKNGERLRSNRLQKGQHIDDTVPRSDDAASIFFTVVEGDLVFRDNEGVLPQRAFQHPGGMQLVGNMLAIAVEGRRDPLAECYASCAILPNCAELCNSFEELVNYQIASAPTMVMFFDVSNPEAPVFTSEFAPFHAEDHSPLTKLGFVAVTPLPIAPGEQKNRYLMTVTGGEHPDHLFFYRSSPDDLSSQFIFWEALGTAIYPDVADAHQTMQFLREGDIHGDLYLAGIRGNANTVLHDDRDKIDLRQVVCTDPSSGQADPLCVPGDEITLALVFPSRLITPRPSTGGDRLVNLAAASGFYISPSGELIMYATEHDNDGPDGTVKAGEWRHINMVRENSPTLLPTAAVGGPYEVDEGSSVQLTGSAGPAITKAWIQLFNSVDFGGTDFSTLYPVVDHDDYDKDDFNDLFSLEQQILTTIPPSLLTFNDKVQSLKWFAPVGCSIALIDAAGGNIRARILEGNGQLDERADLSQSFPDMVEQVDAVEYLPDCDAYYAAPVELQWDLDVDGIYETTGSPVMFNAIAFDGPSVVQVPAQAAHSLGGPPGQTTARVTVQNVAPQLTPLSLTDSAGNEVNVDVPFVLTGLPVTASATFTDPGLPDQQTATIAWGDGSTDAEGAFTTFDEAFGDGTGEATHVHRYALPGTFPIELSVTDDDGGVDSEAVVIDVRTPEQAVEEVLHLLDGVIASTTNSNVLRELLKARKALAGSVKGQSANGALAMIRAGYDEAAIAFTLEQAIFRLWLAQVGGADVATLIALLEQVIAALAAA